MEPSLLYLIGDPKDPVEVWKKLLDTFQRKTWANKLELRRKLYTLRLKDGESIQQHIKAMTEIFDSLAVIGDPVDEEDRVVHLLASLPESFNMLVTALEANPEVPKMETVTERLLHEERKMRDREDTGPAKLKAMTAKSQKRKFTCHYCGKPGHFRRNCRKLAADNEKKDKPGTKEKEKHKANQAATLKLEEDSYPSSDGDALVAFHALSANSGGNWIVDSGATCHMCNNGNMFAKFKSFDRAQEVTLGDGHVLEATGEGIVQVKMKLPDGKAQRCNLRNVLLVPKLAYNLLSVSKAAEAGKTTKFDKNGCQILNEDMKVIAVAKRVGNLFYLECEENQSLSVVAQSKERLWHRRYGHLGEQSLTKLAKGGLINSFDYDPSMEIGFCETCIGGKHQRSPFSTSSTRCKEPLGLVHSDVCGKMSAVSLGGAEYFLTFIDDNTRYVWVYPLKHKDEVFDRFLKWKALVEKSSGRKLKVLRTDNGGEYTSTKFEEYLKAEGVSHERTVPKTPEQNGVAERQNRTLVETTRSMLLDSKLPHKFWAEALSTAAYLRNRCPTKAIDGMTPYEAWTSVKPTVKHLRVFGCDAFAHVTKDERHKLDSKSKKCILLGYGEETKGYRLYDPEKRKVFYSRDVKFNENEREKETPKTTDCVTHHVELDFSDNTEHSDEIETSVENPSETVPRRSERQRKPPDFYGIRVNLSAEISSEPTNIEEAITCSEKAEWIQAMETEIKSLKENDVWELVELPKGKKTVGSKWVYKVKTGADRSVEWYKARLVAQGYTQKYGTDYNETFCPVVRLESL